MISRQLWTVATRDKLKFKILDCYWLRLWTTIFRLSMVQLNYDNSCKQRNAMKDAIGVSLNSFFKFTLHMRTTSILIYLHVVGTCILWRLVTYLYWPTFQLAVEKKNTITISCMNYLFNLYTSQVYIEYVSLASSCSVSSLSLEKICLHWL